MKFQNQKLLQAGWVDRGIGKGGLEVFCLFVYFVVGFFFFLWKENEHFSGLIWIEINMEVKAAGQRELCNERQA